MAKISELDSRILKDLLRDGRTGYDEIAANCRVTKNKIWKRCKAMEERGVISGATIQMNFGHFGFDALATLLISVDAQQIDQTMEFIEKITEVRAYRQYNSVYNVRAVATLRDLNELDHIKQIIKRRLPTIGLKTYIWTGVRNIPENLNLTGTLKDSRESYPRNLNKLCQRQNEHVSIDELDKQIVEKLTLNGRSSFTQIAKEIGVSTDTVVKRYHRLREEGAIKVSIQINPNKIGYNSIFDFNIAFMNLNGFSNSVVEELAKIPDIIIITKTSGDFDLQVTAMIRDIAQSFAIQDEIARICGITKIEVSTRKIPERWPTPQQYISTL
ncbi:MAG: Lrp/AsnC family transcriptional regulator [Candidatus Bathyarchaeia archaeon]